MKIYIYILIGILLIGLGIGLFFYNKKSCKEDKDCNNQLCINGKCVDPIKPVNPVKPCQCNQNQICQSDKCICNTYTSKVDQTVKSRVGKECEYSDNDTCNGKGVVDSSGKCSCTTYQSKVYHPEKEVLYIGDQCQYSDNEICQPSLGIPKYGKVSIVQNVPLCDYCQPNGKNEDNKCICDNGYFDPYCVQCSSDSHCKINNQICDLRKQVCICKSYHSQADGTTKPMIGNECQYSDNDMCNGKGIVNQIGECDCNTYTSQTDGKIKPMMGDHCQYTDNDACNGKGIVNRFGQCVCNTYKSQADESIKAMVGDHCQYNDNDTCNGKGVVNQTGGCKCNTYKSQTDGKIKPMVGDHCQYNDNDTCKGKSIVNQTGGCDCMPGFILDPVLSCIQLISQFNCFSDPDNQYDTAVMLSSYYANAYMPNVASNGQRFTFADTLQSSIIFRFIVTDNNGSFNNDDVVSKIALYNEKNGLIKSSSSDLIININEIDFVNHFYIRLFWAHTGHKYKVVINAYKL